MTLASPNGRSLLLAFDGALHTPTGGVFLGAMPVLQGDDGVFRDLLVGDSEVRLVLITAASITCPRCGLTSHNVNDTAEGYCGNCHDWTDAALHG